MLLYYIAVISSITIPLFALQVGFKKHFGLITESDFKQKLRLLQKPLFTGFAAATFVLGLFHSAYNPSAKPAIDAIMFTYFCFTIFVFLVLPKLNGKNKTK